MKKVFLILIILFIIGFILISKPWLQKTPLPTELPEEATVIPTRKVEDCVCISLWEPVCGVDGQTYSNECWLKCAGVEKAHDGECKK